MKVVNVKGRKGPVVQIITSDTEAPRLRVDFKQDEATWVDAEIAPFQCDPSKLSNEHYRKVCLAAMTAFGMFLQLSEAIEAMDDEGARGVCSGFVSLGEWMEAHLFEPTLDAMLSLDDMQVEFNKMMAEHEAKLKEKAQ